MYDCVGTPCQDEAVIDHFGISCADWDKSKAFYDQVLGVLGYTRQMDFEVAIGYGRDGKPDFWIADMKAGDAPRLWPEYHPGYFGAFVRDPDGNNIEAVFHGAQPGA